MRVLELDREFNTSLLVWNIFNEIMDLNVVVICANLKTILMKSLRRGAARGRAPSKNSRNYHWEEEFG